MEPQTYTVIFMIAVTLVVLGYDLFAWLKWRGEGTISGVMWRAGERWPIIKYAAAFGMGALFGHFWL